MTGLPRCSTVSNWVLTTPSRFRFHSRVHSPPGCFLLDMAANSNWSPAPSPVSTPVYTSLLDQISVPTAFRLTGLRAVALGPCMVIYILLPWMGGWYPGWYLHACYKPHPGLYISHPSDLLVPGQVFLVGKFSALPRPLRGSSVPSSVLSSAPSSPHIPASTSILHRIPSPACDLDSPCWRYSAHTPVYSFTACWPLCDLLPWLSRGRRPHGHALVAV